MADKRSKSPTGSLAGSVRAGPSYTRQFPANHSELSANQGSRGYGDKDDKVVDYFYGDKVKLKPFLIHCKLAFQADPFRFTDGESKVIFAARRLRGAAFNWFEPTLNDRLNMGNEASDETQNAFLSFVNFEQRITQVFGEADEVRAAARKIWQLKQRGSATQYYSQFQQISSKLDWDDEALHAAYYDGLSDSVKDHMMPNPPDELKELIDLSISIDNRLYERRMEKGGRYGAPTYGNRRRDYRGEPMDLGLMQHGRPSRPRPGNRLNDKEREKRKKSTLR